MRSGVVLLEGYVVILHNWKDMWLQNFVTITLSRQITIGVYQVGLSSMWYGCPHHYASASESVDFLDTDSRKMFISSSETLALPSARRNKNLDSSLNQTVLQRCCGLTRCVWAHWSLFWRCRWFKLTPRTGRLALIPAYRRRFRTVWS